jgi:hypothetical protein
MLPKAGEGRPACQVPNVWESEKCDTSGFFVRACFHLQVFCLFYPSLQGEGSSGLGGREPLGIHILELQQMHGLLGFASVCHANNGCSTREVQDQLLRSA